MLTQKPWATIFIAIACLLAPLACLAGVSAFESVSQVNAKRHRWAVSSILTTGANPATLKPVLVIVKDAENRDRALVVALTFFAREYPAHRYNPDATIVVEVPADQEVCPQTRSKFLDARMAPEASLDARILALGDKK